MKLPGFLNPKNIGGQIAALVVASIIAIHLILTATFLVYRPDQAPIERGNGQLAAVVQLLGAAPAVGRPRLFADIARAFPQLDIGSLLPASLLWRTNLMASACEVCIAALAATIRSSRSRLRKTSTRSVSFCRTAQ